MEMMSKAIEDGQQQWIDTLLEEKRASESRLEYAGLNRKHRRAIAAIEKKNLSKRKRHD